MLRRGAVMVYDCFQDYGPGITMIIVCEAPVIVFRCYINGLLSLLLLLLLLVVVVVVVVLVVVLVDNGNIFENFKTIQNV